MQKFIAKLLILITSISILSSCGVSIDTDSNDHCIDHKFDSNDYTCSKYRLIKPDKI